MSSRVAAVLGQHVKFAFTILASKIHVELCYNGAEGM